MAATRSERRSELVDLLVLSLKRPHHEVELFNYALHNDCLLVISEETSNNFICYQIINEFLQNESRKWAVVLVNDSSGLTKDPLIKILDHLQPRKPLVFPSYDEAARLAHQENQNVLLTSPNYLNDCINMGYIHANNISVVIFLTTIKIRLSASDHPAVLKTLCKEAAKLRIIGLVQLGLCDVCNALDLKTKLDILKATYDLPIFMSKDLLAMNAYGEEIAVEVLPYSLKSLSETEKKIWKILHETSVFLQDIIVTGISKSIQNVRAIVAWSIDVLVMFGLWSLSSKLDCIQNTLSNKLHKESRPIVILAVEACKTEFESVQHLLKSQQNAQPVHSCLIYEICDQLAPYKVFCNKAASSVEHTEQEIGADLSSEKKLCVRDRQTAKFEEDSLVHKSSFYESRDTEEACHGEEKFQNKESMKNSATSNKPEIVEKQVQKLKNKSQFHCIIVTQNNSFARMLSKLINYVSACNKKYSFMKSGCVIHSKHTSSEEEERTESVLQAVLQGMVNILVTTMDMVSDLSLTTFNVLVYFGVPVNYQQYYYMKNKIRGLSPKLMLILNDDNSVVCERNLQEFSNIESEIARRVPGYISQENKEKWLKFLSKKPQLKYTPFGEDGPAVSMESSIHLINRYCRRICRGDFCRLTAQFTTEKKDVTENCVEIVSKLYLPLGSYCCTIVEGPPVWLNKESDQEEEVGILKSKMLASLECVKILHSSGKMDSDLDLTEEVYVDVDNEKLQSFELEDEGKGRAGTNKRKRAYEIKVPSFFEDNMPRANETSFLCKIQFEDPTVYKHSKSSSLQSLSEPEFELGILSRKSLPKMPSFPIHTLERDVSVSLETSNPVNIDETALSCIRLFHHYVFKHLHKLDTQSTMLSESDGYLAVPLIPSTIPCHGLQIHYQYLQEFASFFQSICDPDLKLKPAPPCEDFSLFQNKIVRRLNESANQTQYTRYFVVKVCHDLSPDSPFPEPEVASSFAEYYQNRYGIQVHLEQPMLLVQHLPTQVNFITPRYRHQDEKPFQEGSIAKERGPRMEIHLIPELCSILPLSASAWSLARYLPAVVSRLEALLRAHEMKVRILCGTGIGFCRNARGLSEVGLCVNDKSQNCGSVGEKNSMVCTRFDGGDVDDDGGSGIDVDSGWKGSDGAVDGNNTGYGGHGLGDSDYGNDAEYDGDDNGHVFDGNDSVGPSILLILHAITARSAGQQFHSEQLEVLGDSCLKLEVSLELFLTDLEKDEWSLSLYRSYLVSNHTLSIEGRRLGIPGYLSITPPDLTSTSLPPGFIIKPSQLMFGAKKSSLNLYTHQVLGDKHVANCVEALIAAILVDCGRNAARKFLKWVGVIKCTLDELSVFYQRLRVQVDQSGGNQEQVNCVDPVDEEREIMIGNTDVEIRNGISAPRQMNESLANATKSGALEELIEQHNLCDDLNVQDTNCARMEIAREEQEMWAEKIHIKHDGFNSISALDHVISTEEKDNFDALNLEAIKRFGILNTSEERELLSEDLNGRIDGNTVGSRTHDEVCEEGKYHEIQKNKKASQTVHPKSDHLTFSTRPIPRFDHIERELGYSFKNKLLLLQALTHSSYSRILSLVPESYQKMEYLGDAILDYLITLYIFDHFPQLNHGDLTDFRSALVNNFTLAFLAVQNNLHQSLRHLSPPLLDVICQFSQFLKEQELKQGASWKTSVDAFVVGSPEEESSVEVPKVLGDVFEAVVCALFLDSGMNLELVWKVLFPMFKPFIDHYKNNIPLSPVRVLKESFPDGDKVTFSLARLTLSRKYKSRVHVVGYGKFEAIGRTPKIAKAIVARKALQHILNTKTT